MRGHVGQRGHKWYAMARIDGKQRWLGTWSTKADAEAALHEALHKGNQGVYLHPSRQTVAEFLAEWFPGFRYSVSQAHWETLNCYARNYVVPRIGDLPLSKVSHLRLNRLYTALVDSGLSPTTVNNVHRFLRRALRDAPVAVNPAAGASPPRPRRRAMSVWDADTLRAFLKRAEGGHDYLAWLLLAVTGMRRKEVLGLQWKDIDFDKSTVTIGTSKNGRGRVISLDPATLTTLKDHRGIGPIHPPEDERAFSNRFARTIRRWKFPVIRLHDLRHTHATLLLSEGVHPKIVQERLGHSSIVVTMDIYSHVIQGMDKDAAITFANKLANKRDASSS